MAKLLRANFFRLRRSWPLLLCMSGAFALSVIFMLNMFRSSSESHSLDAAFLQLFPFLPILHAAFISLFLGVEYQDGTLRNKLIAGHSPRGCLFFVAHRRHHGLHGHSARQSGADTAGSVSLLLGGDRPSDQPDRRSIFPKKRSEITEVVSWIAGGSC